MVIAFELLGRAIKQKKKPQKKIVFWGVDFFLLLI